MQLPPHITKSSQPTLYRSRPRGISRNSRRGIHFLGLLVVCAMVFGLTMYAFAGRSALPTIANTNPLITTGSSKNNTSTQIPLGPSISSPDSQKLPIYFEANLGQIDTPSRFLARGPSGTYLFSPNEVILTLNSVKANLNVDDADKRKSYLPFEYLATATDGRQDDTQLLISGSFRMHFLGASPNQQIIAGKAMPGKVNYFKGNIPANWHTNVSTYGSIIYEQVYPGIDLHYDNYSSQLKGTYIVAPGADPARIQWRYDTAQAANIDTEGNLQVVVAYTETTKTASSKILGTSSKQLTITEQRPIAWQDISGQRVPVEVRYKIEPNGSIRFEVGNYDRTQPLTLDPTLTYSTYYGGLYTTATDRIEAVDLDDSGNIYIAGYSGYDAFVIKLDPLGTTMLYATLLNGEGPGDYSPESFVNGLFVDSTGYAYAVGGTNSPNFPTENPFQDHLSGQLNTFDAFVTKLSPTGGTLAYSTYLGGGQAWPNFHDVANDVTVDASGSAYVVGVTNVSNFPTEDPLQSAIGGGADAFLAKFSPSGSSLAFSTYLGGSGNDAAESLALDGAGNSHIVGQTDSVNFPTLSAYQSANSGSIDTFVAKVNSGGSALIYSTYFGGLNLDLGYDITLDDDDNVYIVGGTDSNDLPTEDPLQENLAESRDAFVTKFNSTGSDLIYSTYLGGNGSDEGYGIAVSSTGNAYVTGYTESSDFPVVNAIQWVNAGSVDAFAAKLAASGSSLIYSTYLGGGVDAPYDGEDWGYCIVIDDEGFAYVGGDTRSPDFPTTSNALEPNQSGPDPWYGQINPDAFLSVIEDLPVLMATPTATQTPSLTATAPTNTPTATPTVTSSNTPTSTPTPSCPLTSSITWQGDDTYTIEVRSKCDIDTHLKIARFYGPIMDPDPIDGSGHIDPNYIGSDVGAGSGVLTIRMDSIVDDETLEVALQGMTWTINLDDSKLDYKISHIDTEQLILPSKAGINASSVITPALNRLIVNHIPGPSGEKSKIREVTLFLRGMRPLVLVSGSDQLNPGDGTPQPSDGENLYDRNLWAYPTPYAAFGFHPERDPKRDIAGGALLLLPEIDTVKRMFGVQKVNIVAHSMGGLWSRHFATKFDKVRGPDGYYYFTHSIDNLIMLGTPNKGSRLADIMWGIRANCITCVETGFCPPHTEPLTCQNIIIPKVDAAKPGIRELTTRYMEEYNKRYYRPDSCTKYTTLAAISLAEIQNSVGIDWIEFPHDGIVSVESVQALPPAFEANNLTPIKLPGVASAGPAHSQLIRNAEVQAMVKPFYLQRANHYGQTGRSGITCSDFANPIPDLSQYSETLLDNVDTWVQWPATGGAIESGQTQTVTVAVDSSDSASFSLSWADQPTTTLELSLRDPMGSVITPTSSYTGAVYLPDVLGIKYVILDPLAGEWQVVVEGMNVPVGQVAYILGGEFEGGVQLNPELSAPSVGLNEPVAITSTLLDPDPVTSSLITASIVLLTNDSFAEVVPLVEQVGGVYTGQFTPTEMGTYLVTLFASGINNSLEPFTRTTSLQLQASSSASLSGTFSEHAYGTGTGVHSNLLITTTVAITDAGSYSLSGSLTITDGREIAFATDTFTLTTGTADLPLNFAGSEIGASGANGPYQLRNLRLTQLIAGTSMSDELTLSVTPLAYTTTSYLRQEWPRGNVVQTGPASEAGVDTNSNSLYDYLEVTVPVDVLEAGVFSASINLLDSDGNLLVTTALLSLNLVEGGNTVVARFDGRSIRAMDVDGPYGVSDLSIWKPGEEGSSSTIILVLPQTQAYSSSDFEIPLATPTPTFTSTPTSTPTPTSIFGLLSEYFNRTNFTSHTLTRYDGAVNVDWGENAPDPQVGPETFSVRWTGEIEALAATGTYTFYTTSDDGVRLWVDDLLIIEDWNDHGPTENSGTIVLESGQRYNFKLDFYDNTAGAMVKLEWEPPNGNKQVVSSSQLYPPPAPSGTNGLVAEYYNDTSLTTRSLLRYDSSVNFDWGDGSPDPIIQDDGFSARWSGSLKTPDDATGTYTFTTTSDEGVRLWLDDELIIDNWTAHTPTEDSGQVELSGGQTYDIKLEYYEQSDGAMIRLEWEPPNNERGLVPSSRLYPIPAESVPTPTATYTATPVPSNCEAVVWTDMENVTANGNDLHKPMEANEGWDAGAVSTVALLSGDGYAEFTAKSTASHRMFGLSNGNNGVGYEDIDFAAHLQAGGALIVYEQGNYIDTFGTYEEEDVIRVAKVENEVFYYQNGSPFYTSTLEPVLPLLIEAGLYQPGSSIEDAYICGDNLGIPPTATPTFTPTPTNTPRPISTITRGLVGEYFNRTDLTNLALTRYDGLVNFNWGGGSPDTVISPETFSARWIGEIETLAATGTYTFYTTSDEGVRLWVDDELIIDNWTAHGPTEDSGTIALDGEHLYDIKLEYYDQSGDAQIVLEWEPPNEGRRVVPSVQLFPPTSASSTNGLVGEYYNDPTLTSRRFLRYDSAIDFDWSDWSPDPVIQDDGFSVRWTGSLRTPPGASGTYTFYTISDDGVRLWVDDELILENWTGHAPTEDFGVIELNGGQTYDIKLEYYEDWGGAMIRLEWEPPNRQREVVPSSRLYPISAGSVPTPTATYTPTPVPANCESVIWTDLVNVTADGNSIEKIDGADPGWDAGAASTGAILSGDGYVEFRATTTNYNVMFGLSHNASGAGYEDIDFATHLQAGGALIVFEQGQYIDTFGTYDVGDNIRVAKVDEEVVYYLNGSPFYTSTLEPVLPLLVDASLHELGASIQDAYLCGDNLGLVPTSTPTLTPTATDTPSPTPTGDAPLDYSSYLGGAEFDSGYSTIVDGDGDIYLVGSTSSTDFPTEDPLQSAHAGGDDLFITKLSADGSTLLYATYLGGAGSEYAADVAVDDEGNLYVTGWTDSTDFPTQDPYQEDNEGATDGFLVKLNASGSNLVFSTYLGGSGYDGANRLAIDEEGYVYLLGDTMSSDFPTEDAYQSTYGGGEADVFVTKVYTDGSGLVYSTYLGGTDVEYGTDMVVDSNGSTYLTGGTYSTDFPTANAYQSTRGGQPGTTPDAFVTKLNPAGSALTFSTYLGGESMDAGAGIAIDSMGKAYVAGFTTSDDFPAEDPYQGSRAGGSDAFIAQLSPSGEDLDYSTYLGGSNGDGANSIRLDQDNNVYVVGNTSSTDFPLAGIYQPTNHGATDAFVASLDLSTSSLEYSTYLGGSDYDYALRLFVNPAAVAYITGRTHSTDFPTQGPYQSSNASNAGGADAFISVISDARGEGLLGESQSGGQNQKGQSEQSAQSGTNGQKSVQPQPCEADFRDMVKSDPSYEYVQYLKCLGAVSGFDDKTYRPNGLVTRGQLAKLVVIALNLPTQSAMQSRTARFSDVPLSHPLYKYVETAYQRGIFVGYPGGLFKPDGMVTRAQMAKVVVLASGLRPTTPARPSFIDVTTDSVYYQYIETAYAYGLFDGYPNHTFKPDEPATRGQVSKIIYTAANRLGNTYFERISR